MAKQPSQAQIQANRLNAQRSTGPRSEEGKAVSAQNAAKPDPIELQQNSDAETLEKLRVLRESMIESLQPANELEMMLIERIVLANYSLMKLAAAEADYFKLWEIKTLKRAGTRERSHLGLEPLQFINKDKWNAKTIRPPLPKSVVTALMLDDESCPLQRIQQHEARIETSIHRALRQLRLLQSKRAQSAEEKKSQNEPNFLSSALETKIGGGNEPNRSQIGNAVQPSHADVS